MSCTIQMTVDSRDPHAQADWWAQTLGWSVEPSDEDFIRTMIGAGHATESDTLLHNGTLVWREGAAICPAGQADGPGRQRILFQSVPEPKAGKNRVHWDVTLVTTTTRTRHGPGSRPGERHTWRRATRARTSGT
jgi:hypothetical protein